MSFNDLHNTIQKPIIDYNEAPTTIGDKIQNKRLQLKLFQKDIADFIGVPKDAFTY